MAVTGRKRTLFLSLFDHFFRVCTVITLSINKPYSSKLIFSNSYLCTNCIPTFGLKVKSIIVGELIELSQLKTEQCLFSICDCHTYDTCTEHYMTTCTSIVTMLIQNTGCVCGICRENHFIKLRHAAFHSTL